MSSRFPVIEGELELEDEWEGESEYEFEAELEEELEGEFEAESEYEYESEYELEDELEFDFEAEAEAEAEGEAEGFVNPVRRVYPDAELMAHLGRAAAESESEEEAEAFIGALVPIAARLIPRAASLVARHAPTLIRGASRVVRRLRSDPATRRLVATLPVIAQRTVQSLADQAGSGRPIDGDTVFRTIGRMTQRVLGDPANARRAGNAVAVFDRRWHMANRRRRRPVPRVRYGRPAVRARRTRARVR
jgi:hypothetical protein